MPTRLTISEANEEMERMFGMLDEFEEYIILRSHSSEFANSSLVRVSTYKSLGKFLRAFERNLLVTSTVRSVHGRHLHSNRDPSRPLAHTLQQRTQTRRQHIPGGRNRTSAQTNPSPMLLNGDAEVDVPPSPRLGLVDELDDPSADSNHLADHPRALSATTNLAVTGTARAVVDMDDMDMDDADLSDRACSRPRVLEGVSRAAAVEVLGQVGAALEVAGRVMFERGREDMAASAGIDPTSPTAGAANSGEGDTEMDVDENAINGKGDKAKES
ncbi:hypothetical protein FRB90_011928 [Tulasnella sp. 427]|nr:hypothetical protein FRB90_011928 [Tulasnella sp. 427]